jgi:hypothetical protein
MIYEPAAQAKDLRRKLAGVSLMDANTNNLAPDRK